MGAQVSRQDQTRKLTRSRKHLKPTDKDVEAYIERQLARLPPRLGSCIRRLRHQSPVWLRLTAAALLIIGGVLWFLPLVGLWMLPLGLLLLADQFPAARRWLVGIAMRFDRFTRPKNDRPPV
jgi:hypothetical protein